MALSSPGIGSNLDINSIITQLMAAEQKPLTNISRKEAGQQAKLSAIGSLKSALSSFQSTVQSLSDISRFQAVKASVAESGIASASGTGNATPGTYSLEISKLAQAQKLASAGQASASTGIGTGTITFDFGTIELGTGTFDSATGKYTGAGFNSNGAGLKTVKIDASNNSLSGIRDAINSANIGVTASIVNDGGTSPYRLVLTQQNTGKTNSMKISVAEGGPLATLLNHNPSGTQAFSETMAAQNAEFKVDGVSVSKTSNTVTDVIAGVTLTLNKTNAGSPTNITVIRDTNAVAGSVVQFVSAYNQINQSLLNLSSYNPATKQAAVLNGDSTLRMIQTQIRGVLAAPVTGGSAFSVLNQIGVSLQKDGTLSVDNDKLQKAVNNNFSDVASLFAAAGKASDSLVSYVGATEKATPGSYAVNVTQLATQGKSTGKDSGGLPFTANLAIDENNDTLNVQLDGLTATVKIAQGNYANATALAAEIQSKINGVSAFTSGGSSVKVTQTGGVLTLTSARYGSASNISITGGNGKAALLGDAPDTVAGVDVAGTIGGIAATGSGQFLTGAGGSGAEGLKLQITGTNTGSRGTVSYAKGYASQFDKLIKSLLASDGPISSRTEGINDSLKSLDKQKERINDRLVEIEKRYRAQFTSLDVMLSNMTKTSNFLAQQLANLPTIE